jgi:hypothetical protein
MMPYLENRNARNYLREHPDHNRLKIVRFPNLYTLLWPRILSRYTVIQHFSGSRLSPPAQDRTQRFESEMCITPYLRVHSFSELCYSLLIDHGGQAVLCDFGLSRVTADLSAHQPQCDNGWNY